MASKATELTIRSTGSDRPVRVPADALNDPRSFLDAVTDIPNDVPRHRIPLTRAGIGDQEISFRLASFVDPGGVLTVNGTVGAWTGLRGDRRGVHMSRLVESVIEMGARTWQSADEFIRSLAADVCGRQDAQSGSVSLSARTRIERCTPVARRVSPDIFGIDAQALVDRGRVTSRVGLTATIITACPCTQAYSWYSSVLDVAKIVGIDAANELCAGLLSYTHSQRAKVSILAEAGDDGVTLADCYAAICESTHVVHELLKRPDEHRLVRAAHERPQFTEDVVRDVAAALVRRTTGRSGASSVHIESAAIESIHAHTVESMLDATLDELRGYLAASLDDE